VGAYCHTLPEKDQFLCLEGLSRQLQLTYSDDTERIAAECAKLGDEAVMCRALAAEAAYIYGSRSAGTLNVCMSVPEAQKSGCYEVLFRGIAISYSATSTRLTACTQDIPEAGYRSACTDWMHTPEGGMHF
jgi:hypothetical protein